MTRHLYIIGIGGVGTIWIADYALKQGWKVSGSDVQETAEVTRLREAGADIHIGSNPAAIPVDVTEGVMTSAATPTSPSYPEFEELVRRGVPVVKRAQWIGKLTRQYHTISVCGAHGKTTTTAMIGWILAEAGLDPTVFVGGTVGPWKGTRIGAGKYLVLESDEFDRSFHNFYPQIAVVLNIDLDHTDYYTKGLPEIEHSYRRFLRNLPKDAVVVGYGRDGRVRKAVKGFKYRERWYDEAHLWPGVRVPQPGIHNLLNATAAARVAHELGISQEVIKKALATFPGAGRRFEYLGKWNAAELYDDYAHHPKEIAATLSGLHEKFGTTKQTVVFQPHQKARTKTLLKEFGRAFDEHPVTRLILAPIYHVAGREEGIEIESDAIAREIDKYAPPGMKVEVAADITELESLVKEASKQGGVLMVMGAGNIRALTDRWRTE
ncbi:MAG: UDP-N-acetylmuramate--L-alanine ligase [Candidatus Paceibacterota bacterium]